MYINFNIINVSISKQKDGMIIPFLNFKQSLVDKGVMRMHCFQK